MSRNRQSVTFTDEAAEYVERLARDKGLSVSEVVRRGVVLEKWLQDIINDNGKILVQRPGEDSPREVEFLG